MTNQTVVQGQSPSRRDTVRGWALFILLMVYTSNFIDRTILNVLGQSIKTDLKLSDFELGLLTGLAFAAFYVILGVAFGWLADRMNRKAIIVVSLALWSAFTAACGFAANYGQLFLLRMGVGVGEAGCSPAAQSMLSDYYPPKSRSTALGVYSMGIALGSLFGAIAAGWIDQHFGWRKAFLVVGLPGLLLALICLFTLKEPKRGAQDPSYQPAAKAPSLIAVARQLFGNRSFPHIAFGASLGSMGGYGLGAFVVAFLLRGPFGLDKVHAASYYGILFGLTMAVGIALGGLVTDWSGKLSPRAYAIIPGIGFLLCSPLYVLAFRQTDIWMLAAFVVAPLILQYLYLGPTFAVSHNLVGPRMRATATALLFLPINLIGLGIGPPLVGWLSDQFAQHGFGGGAFHAMCPAGGEAAKTAAAALKAQCHAASFYGVKWAIVVTAGVVYAWAGLHYLLGARTLKQDLAKAAEA